MTAIEKLRAAFAKQATRNVDPHEEHIFVASQGTFMADGIAEAIFAPPERESWQDDDDASDDEGPDYLSLFDVLCALDEIAELSKRPPIDKPEEAIETDPGKRYMQLAATWKDMASKLAYYKEQEKELRLVLFGATFANPKEGTNTFKLADGSTAKGQYKINRKVDEAALPATLQAMRDAGVANTDSLINYKPTLAKREWNSLSPENKLLFSSALIATPGTPTFTIEPPKGSK